MQDRTELGRVGSRWLEARWSLAEGAVGMRGKEVGGGAAGLGKPGLEQGALLMKCLEPGHSAPQKKAEITGVCSAQDGEAACSDGSEQV